MAKYKIGSIYINKKRRNVKVRLISKSYMYVMVTAQLNEPFHLEPKKITYRDFAKNWTLSIGSVLKQL